MTRETGSHVVWIQDEGQARLELAAIGVSPAGVECMKDKARFYCLKVKEISCKSANILKQEMLSRGGEAAVNAQTVYAQGKTDVLLMGTRLQLLYLAEKLERQPLGLQDVAQNIRDILAGLEQDAFSLALPNGKKWELPKNRTQIMGIVNVTPDSFSDGGCYFQPQDAIRQALELTAQGADLIDLGAVSSRPGAALADEQEEWRRLEPVVKALASENILLSIDTFRASVAQRALEAGAHIINDIGGFHMDKGLAKVVAEAGCPVVMMHNRMQIFADQPYTDFLSDVVRDLEVSREIGLQAGVKPEQIIVDPGVGFGKTPAQNRLLVKNLGIFRGLGHPILLGLSRKSFIADTLPSVPLERDDASIALEIVGALQGAHILRVHEVLRTKQMMRIVDEVRNENG